MLRFCFLNVKNGLALKSFVYQILLLLLLLLFLLVVTSLSQILEVFQIFFAEGIAFGEMSQTIGRRQVILVKTLVQDQQ